MNNQTGAIMAMASYPTFDNRWFSADVPTEKFAQLFPTTEPDGSPLDPDKAALTNRAIQGQYNVGSTFKPFTAYAALATGQLAANTIYNDQGTYQLSERLDQGGSLRRGGALRVPQLDVPARQHPVPVRPGERRRPRSPSPATRSSTTSARSSS